MRNAMCNFQNVSKCQKIIKSIADISTSTFQSFVHGSSKHVAADKHQKREKSSSLFHSLKKMQILGLFSVQFQLLN